MLDARRPRSLDDLPILGHRKDGRPIRLIAGGNGDDGGDAPGGQAPADPGGAPAAAPATPPAPARTAPAVPAAPQAQAPAAPAGGGLSLADQGITPQSIAAALAAQQPKHVTDSTKDFSRQPQWVQDEVRRLRDENAGWRHRYKEADEGASGLRQAIADAAGLDVAEVNPDSLNDLFGYAAAEAQRALVQQAVYKAAYQHGVDPSALLDSASFLDRADGMDPTEDGFGDALSSLVREMGEANPRFRATDAGQVPARNGPSRSGAPIPGGSGNQTQITESALDSMTPKEIAAALEDGRLKHLL